MRQEPSKAQMREVAAEHIDKISIVARAGYAKHGKGFVWLQFMFVGEWQMRVEFMPLAEVMNLGMRQDSMATIESMAKQCDPTAHAAILIFKGDHFEGAGLMELDDGTFGGYNLPWERN